MKRWLSALLCLLICLPLFALAEEPTEGAEFVAAAAEAPPVEEPPHEDPPKEEPPKEEPPKEEPPKEEPPKEEPPKEEPPKEEPPKVDPPKEQPQKEEPPKAKPTPEPTKQDPIELTIEPDEVKPKKKSISGDALTIDNLRPGTLADRLDELGAEDADYQRIESLTFSWGMLGDDDFKTIRKFENLRALNLRTAALVEDVLPDEALMGMKALREVRLPTPEDNEKDRLRAQEIGKRAFKDCAKLESVAAISAVFEVGDEAFMNCAKLSGTIKMANLITLGDRVFSGCSRLKGLNFPKLEMMGTETFYACVALTGVELPSVRSIGNGAFQNCDSLETFKSGKSAFTIGDGAFYGLTSLKDASLSNATSIGARAFFGCNKLTNVSLADCKNLGSDAFYGCKRLETVKFPKGGFDTVGGDCFEGCALDFSKGFPSGMGANNTGLQRPRIYFSLNKSKQTIYVDEDYELPKAYLRTKEGTSIARIVGDSWVDPDLEVPKVSRSPKNVDTGKVGKTTIRFTIPKTTFADTHENQFVLNVKEEVEPTPAPTPTPTPRPTPEPTPQPTPPPVEAEWVPDDIEYLDEGLTDDPSLWATLPGLTFGEASAILDRAIYQDEHQTEVQDFALQMMYPIDLDIIAVDEPRHVPLTSRGYQVGDLVITRQSDNPQTLTVVEPDGLIFELVMKEEVKLLEATLQIARVPEQIDPYLAQQPYDAYTHQSIDPKMASALQAAASIMKESANAEVMEPAFKPFDALLDESGDALLYVNASVEYDQQMMPLYVMSIDERVELTDLMKQWILVPEEDVDDAVDSE